MLKCVRGLFVLSIGILLIGGISAPVQASSYDTFKIGPAVGAKIPHDLKTADHTGQERDFKSLAHKRGLVILFTRSLDW